MKIHKIHLKERYGSTHIVPDKTLAKVFEAIDGNLYIILVRVYHPYYKGQAIFSLDEKVLDILENTTLFERFVLLIKIDQTFVIAQ